MTINNDSHLDRMASNEAKDQQAQSAVPEIQDEITQDFLVPVRVDAADTVTTFTTVVSTATNPVALLLPRDPDRLRAQVITIDQDVVLANTRELAGNPDNQVASVPHPRG